jgi:hypothetical protein
MTHACELRLQRQRIGVDHVPRGLGVPVAELVVEGIPTSTRKNPAGKKALAGQLEQQLLAGARPQDAKVAVEVLRALLRALAR